MRHVFSSAAGTTVLAAGLVGLVAANASAQDMRAAIDAGNRQFEQAIAKGDGTAVASLYSSTAEVLPPNGEPMQGPEAISKLWQGFLAGGIRDIKLTTREVTGAGDAAVEVGNYEIKTPDGKLADRGKYVVIWKKEGGRWKLHRDIWNSSQPMAH